MSFFKKIQNNLATNSFYGLYIKPTDHEHEYGRIYHISKQFDKTLYSGDNRGIGQGGYISNILDTYFVECSKDLYDAQNFLDKLYLENNIIKNKSFILCLTCGDTYEHVPTILLVNAPNKEFIINNIEKIKKEQDLNSTKYSIQSISELDMTKMHILITEGFIE